MIVFEQLANVFDSFVFFYFIYKSETTKHNTLANVFGFAIYLIAIVSSINILNVLQIFDSYGIIVYTIINFAFMLFYFHGAWQRKLLISFLPVALSLVSSLIVSATLPLFIEIQILQIMSSSDKTRVIAIVFAKSLQLLLILFALKVMKKNFHKLSRKVWLGFAIVFFITALCAVFAYELMLSKNVNYNTTLFLGVCICLVLINIAVFCFFALFVKFSNQIHALNLNKTLILEEVKSYEKIDEIYSEMRKFRHDIKHQHNVVLSLIANKEYNEAESYLKKAEENFQVQNNFLVSKNKALNATMNMFISKSKECGIKFDYDIKTLDIGKIDDYDICSIISNLLNNAFEASNVGETVFIKIFNKNNYMFLHVKNNIQNSVLQGNPNLKTTKSNLDLHGFGIPSVRYIANKYDGAVDFFEDNNIFCVKICLKITNCLKKQ